METRRSISGYIIKFGSNVITWCLQRQSTVAVSTTEAEYIAGYESVKEVMWMNKLLLDLGLLSQIHQILYIDNKSTIELIKNPIHHKRFKHIDNEYHYQRKIWQKGL